MTVVFIVDVAKHHVVANRVEVNLSVHVGRLDQRFPASGSHMFSD